MREGNVIGRVDFVKDLVELGIDGSDNEWMKDEFKKVKLGKYVDFFLKYGCEKLLRWNDVSDVYNLCLKFRVSNVNILMIKSSFKFLKEF